MAIIKNNVNLNWFSEDEKELLENVIDELYSTNNLKVKNKYISNDEIKTKLKLLTNDNLKDIIQIKNNSKNIKNNLKYLTTCLYNMLGNLKKNYSNSFRCENERNYTDEFWDSLYVN